MTIYPREELVELIQGIRIGKRVGYTSGVFDILHSGHVDYLARARAACDILVVGVNSDSSVRGNKGRDRPIVTAVDRAAIVASLRSVDYVFIFNEENNHRNVELLKPDIYFKASDYSSATLTSRPIVEGYGGRVELVPVLSGYSSSGIIQKIQGMFGTSVVEDLSYEPRPAVFVDRDGTIVEHVEYLHDPKQMFVLPYALEGLRRFQEEGYRIIVLTNQPGIGLGYYSREDFYRVNRELLTAATKANVSIDRVYYCPHSKADNCRCRKPATGMLERAVDELNIDLESSLVIGDMTGDIMLGKNFGLKTFLVKTGRGGDDKLFEVQPDFTAVSLLDAANQWFAS